MEAGDSPEDSDLLVSERSFGERKKVSRTNAWLSFGVSRYHNVAQGKQLPRLSSGLYMYASSKSWPPPQFAQFSTYF